MLEQIEALYGPIKKADHSADVPQADARIQRPGLATSLLRTLLFVSAAFLVWYALAGGEASVQRVVELLRSRVGAESATLEADTTPEYILATQAMHADRLAPDDPLVLQFKVLLDALAPKCREDRIQLARAAIDAHAVRLVRGVEKPLLALLADADNSLSEQTRSTWPASCADVLRRL